MAPRDPQTPKIISLELSTTYPKCYIFLESLGPDLQPPTFRSPSGPPAIKLTHKEAPHLGGPGGTRWSSECMRLEVRTQGFQKYITLGVCDA